VYATTRNEHELSFRRDLCDVCPHWNSMATIYLKLERQQFAQFIEKSRKGIATCSCFQNVNSVVAPPDSTN
jgi:hypothetical protein